MLLFLYVSIITVTCIKGIIYIYNMNQPLRYKFSVDVRVFFNETFTRKQIPFYTRLQAKRKFDEFVTELKNIEKFSNTFDTLKQNKVDVIETGELFSYIDNHNSIRIMLSEY